MPTTTILPSQGNTIISQGSFISTGNAQVLSIPSGFSWMQVENETAADQDTADLSFLFLFQVSSNTCSGNTLVFTKLGTQANDPVTVDVAPAALGITPFTSGGPRIGNRVATTNGTNAVQPVYTTATTAGLSEGSIVRLTNQDGQLNMCGYDWAIDTVVADTSFRIAATLANTPGNAAGNGFYRIVPFNPLFYPPYRYICDAQSVGATTVLRLTVPSNYLVGQEVRVLMPDAFGMTQINELVGTVLAVDDTLGNQTITLNIDSSSFDAFDFPQTFTQGIASRAMVVPVGIDTATALGLGVNVLVDSVTNNGFIGATLAAGTTSPAGQDGDVIKWIAGTSYSNIGIVP